MERLNHREQKIQTPSQLEGELVGSTELGYEMSRYLMNRGLLRGLEITPDSWVSRSRISEGTISLGAGDIDTTMLEKLYFGKPTQKDAVVHRFLHEMGHLYLLDPAAEKSNEIEYLRQFAGVIRNQLNDGGRGLSAIGSLDFYKTHGSPVEEDITDLIAMRLKGEYSLNQFAGFLVNPAYESERARIGLATITTDASAHLIETIEDIVMPLKS